MGQPASEVVAPLPVDRPVSWHRRPVLAGLTLLAVYVALSFFNEPHAYLGTDTGGKVTTLEAMTSANTTDPDIGYWAEEWDPEGRLHPYWFTSSFGSEWIQLSTLPMTYAGYPLYDLGGYRAALALPMLGATAAAFAARALARRLREEDEWKAFWIVGLASPMTIYALDFWEHSIGVALMGWAMVLLLDVAQSPPEGAGRLWPKALGAGLLFGAAATMRTEALVYGFAVTAVACVWLLVRNRRVVPPILAGLAVSVGFVLPMILNSLLESAVLGSVMRASRSASVVSAGGGRELGSRVEEAAITALSVFPSDASNKLTLSFGAVCLIGVIAVLGARRRDPRLLVVASAAVSLVYLLRLTSGLGFVPGMLAAAPLGAVGLALGWRSHSGRLLLVAAILPLPIAWAYQYTSGAVPQWGGRYILPTGFVLTVLGVTSLHLLPKWTRQFLVGLAMAVTLFGLAWMSDRTHDMASAQRVLSERPEPVLVSTVAHLVREGGPLPNERRWLTATTADDRELAAEVVAEAGYDEFGLVSIAGEGPGPDEDTIGEFRRRTSTIVPYIGGFGVEIATYMRVP